MSYALAYFLAVAAITIGVVALAAGGFVLRESIRDRNAIRSRGIGNGRAMVARSAVRADTARLLSIVLLTGGMAVLLVSAGPPPPEPREPVSAPFAAFLAAYNAALAVMAGNAVLGLFARRHLDAELASHHRRLSEADAVPRRGGPNAL